MINGNGYTNRLCGTCGPSNGNGLNDFFDDIGSGLTKIYDKVTGEAGKTISQTGKSIESASEAITVVSNEAKAAVPYIKMGAVILAAYLTTGIIHNVIRIRKES